jgi:acetylglutamate kinase
MQKVIAKADVLIEALPYIQEFRDAIVVIKLGGSAMENEDQVSQVLTDVAFMECVGMKPVVVHGGGKAISKKMEEDGIKPTFVQGRRVTCAKAIKVVEKVMKEQLNPAIVATLKRAGAKVEGLHGDRVFKVRRKTEVDKVTGKAIDWGFVGEPEEVNVRRIMSMLNKKIIPVITPLGIGPDRKIHNINADTAAAAVAKALKARKLAFLSDVPGLLRNPKDPSTLITTLRVSDVKRLVKEGVISGGMLPKIESCVEALKAGVRKIHLVDGRMPHSLLLEIFTDKGVGTEILADD